MNDRRPDPDTLLRHIAADEQSASRGILKVFLGMCAGVGKTYAMLESAQREQASGTDVVVGLVESHGRAETEKLLHSLEVLPRRAFAHRGRMMPDLDVDAILARRPTLVLIDELAHTNAPGMRHRRRYQDIEEILNHGINVFTTLNVQHLESRADDVERITGVPIRERVPDSVLALATDIEVVDLTPDELLLRLQAGKVYTPDRSKVARMHFFRRGNLVALREMALRTAAERVDRDLRSYREKYSIEATWPTVQTYLVAVGATPTATRLVRWAYRNAQEHSAAWTAACVRGQRSLSRRQQTYLQDAVDLVEELGGEVQWIDDDDVVSGLLMIAHRVNATTIIVGKPRRRTPFRFLTETGIVAKLIARSEDVNIHVATASTVDQDEERDETDLRLPRIGTRSSLLSYATTMFVSGIMILAGLFMLPMIGYQAVGMILLLFVMILPVIAPRGPVVVATIVVALSWNALFIPPRFTFTIARLEDQLTFILYFITALTSSLLSTRIRRRESVIRHREEITEQLYTLAAETNASLSIPEITAAFERRIRIILDSEVTFLIPSSAGSTEHFEQVGGFDVDSKEMAVAVWAFDNHKPAGFGTDTLPFARARYIPLVIAHRAIAVMGLRPVHERSSAFTDLNVLDRVVRQAAWSIERIRLTDEAQRVQRAEDAEQFSRTILNAVSHELRTPMASIIASASTLDGVLGATLTDEQRTLVRDISSSSLRLNSIVTDLLDMARIDAGKIHVHTMSVELQEPIEAVLNEVRSAHPARKILVEVDPPDPTVITVDPTLLTQVLRTLLDNAVRHTPDGTTVVLSARVTADAVTITVDDDGPGIPDADLDHVFERFWKGTRSSGSGLGLSIVRGLIQAMGGRIVASRSPIGGARFMVILPQQEHTRVIDITADPRR